MSVKLKFSFLTNNKSEPMSKRTVKKETESTWVWKDVDSCIIGHSVAHISEKIAGFDMDSTLIETKSGAKFAKNADDWVYWNPCVPEKLRELVKEGFAIVIFTNQKGISTGQTKAQDIKTKIENIAKDVGVEMHAVIATKDDAYRKPGTKMWDLFIQNNGNVKLAESFYCGDAAGRKDGKKKDFSDSDL